MPLSINGFRHKEDMGHKQDAQGLRYELRVANHFTKQGWSPQFRVIKYGYEFDLYAVKNDFLGGSEHLVVECKDKELVSAKDIVRYIKKVDIIYKNLQGLLMIYSKLPLHAYLCYSGEVDEDAADVVKTHKPSIKLLKIPRK